MTNGTIIPVEQLASLAELTAGKVRYEQGVYNMGLMPYGSGYYGMFRNCTRNARHLLGWPSMAEGEYQNLIYHARFTGDFKLMEAREVFTFGRVIHDVRLTDNLIGCEKVDEKTFYPVMLKWDEHFRLSAHRLNSHPGKNWNELGRGFDCGWIDGAGLGRATGVIPQIVQDIGPELRGSAPAFNIGDRLITTYHAVYPDHQDKRSYWHYFAELEPHWPHPIKRLSFPFKFSQGGDPGRIQFLMACFQEPGNSKNFIVSYGIADADNIIGRIRTADIIGLLS